MQGKRNKIWEKILASVLVVALTAGNLMLIGSSVISYAVGNLENQDEATAHENVEFGAYFESEGKKAHSLVCDVQEEEKLYFHLNVKQAGFLKNGRIELQEANYCIKGELGESEVIATKEGNTLALKQISYGTEAILEIPIGLEIGDVFRTENVNKNSKVVLKGTYVTSEGKEIEINKEVTLNVAWESVADIEAKSEIITYQSYNQEEKGIILQERIEIEKKQASLPISKTQIEVTVPTFAGIKPDTVRVSSNRTEMTNGKQDEEVEINWNYNKVAGIVEIEVQNEEVEGNIYSKQEGKDEYTITYEYGEEAYEKQELGMSISRKADIHVENMSQSDNKTVDETIENEDVLTEEIGNIVNGEIESEGSINKARIYANYNSNNREYETDYQIKTRIHVVKADLVEGITVEEIAADFIDIDEVKRSSNLEGVDYIYYKTSKIAVDNFHKILGQEGSIVIENTEGEEIGRIDKNNTNQDGYYVVNYENKEANIVLKTSKPEVEGTLIIKHTKAIKADLDYSKEEVESFISLQENSRVSETSQEKQYEITGSTQLTEAVSNLKLESNKESINNKKEEIELRVEFGNNQDNSILYSNPTVTIDLPKFVEEVEINNANLLLEEELDIKNSRVIDGEDGQKAIEINLQGTQTRFNSLANGNGSTLVVGATLISKEAGEGEFVAEVEGNTAVAGITSYLKATQEEDTEEEQDQVELGEETNEEETQEKPRINLHISSSLVKAKEDDIVTYIIYVSDVTDYDEAENGTIENIVVKDFLPAGVTFEKASMEKYNTETLQYEELENAVEYDVKNRVATWNVGKMSGGPQAILRLKVKINALSQGIYDKEISNSVTASYDGMTNITSNVVKLNVVKAQINIIKTSENIGNTNKEGDIVKLILTGENVGELVARDFNATMVLPEELEPISMRYGIDSNITSMSQGENNIELWKVDLSPKATYLFEVEAKIKDLPSDYTEQYKEITVNATMNNKEVSWTIKIENSNDNSGNSSDPSDSETPDNPEKPQEPDMPNNPDETKTYTISGTAWLDDNKNGIKEVGEELLEQIKVKLLKENTSIKETTTDKTGKYTFEQVEQGEYQIAFEYDANLYGVTEYRKTGNLEVNSSAIKTEEGQAVTDIVKLANANVQYINIGLTKIPTFDMSLSKVVSRVIVQNSQGTKKYEYGNDYAKLDINGKYLNETVVLVEYKITIKNEGELAGRVKKIVDYVPKDMIFSTEMNRTWIQDSYGNLYNSELKDIDIEPGETKEITVVLKKKMTEENTGIINNTAEIVEVENSENIKDKDSTPNNKVQGEDDMSSANVLIGVKTGTEVMHITLGLVILIVLAVGIYLINKEVLRK